MSSDFNIFLRPLSIGNRSKTLKIKKTDLSSKVQLIAIIFKIAMSYLSVQHYSQQPNLQKSLYIQELTYNTWFFLKK